MNKLFSYSVLCLLLLLAGCSSQSPGIGGDAVFGENKASMEMRKAVSPLAEPLWIIQEGLQGEAGLYAGVEALPVKAIDMNVEIIEFLASVDISLTYLQVDSKEDLSFRYPSFIGMLVRDFQMKVGERRFRAVISEKESAEALYKLAMERGFNAVVVSQKAFGEMVVKASLQEKSDIEILFSYTQLSSFTDQQRTIAFPEIKGMENADFNMEVKGRFLAPLKSFSGLNKKVSGNKFSEKTSDREILKGGLLIKYSLSELHGVSADKKTLLEWDAKSSNYRSLSPAKMQKYSLCDSELLKPAFEYLKLIEMFKKDRPFKEIEEHAVRSKLLTPITRLLLIDSAG